jgi:nucleoside 2-deoxyribosyltransferase
MSGPLTGLAQPEEVKGFYVALRAACAEAGLDLYLPHLFSDPTEQPGLTPRQVYELDREQIAAAELVVAYVGLPSLGVGCEVEIAREHGVPVILLAEQACSVSRMIRGNPAVIGEIRFNDYADGVQLFGRWLVRER